MTRAEFAPVVLLISILPAVTYHASAFRLPGLRLGVAMTIFLALAPCLVLPTLRNAYYFQEFIPMTASGGKTLWLATIHSDTFYFSGKNRPVLLANYVPNRPGMTDKNFQELALRDIRERPGYYAVGVLERLIAVNFHAFGEPPIRGKPITYLAVRILLRASKFLMMIGFFAGAWWAWRHSRIVVAPILIIYIIKYIIIHSIYNGMPRMFFPFTPVALTCSVLGCRVVWDRFREGTFESTGRRELTVQQENAGVLLPIGHHE